MRPKTTMTADLCRAFRGPRSVKHKGAILRSDHKQNGHKSPSAALTYRFSHSTGSAIITWPWAFSCTGINRAEHLACVNVGPKRRPCFIFCSTCQENIFCSLICTSVAAGAQHDRALKGANGLRHTRDEIISGGKQGFWASPEESDVSQLDDHQTLWTEPNEFRSKLLGLKCV